jgi:hypothetical protein
MKSPDTEAGNPAQTRHMRRQQRLRSRSTETSTWSAARSRATRETTSPFVPPFAAHPRHVYPQATHPLQSTQKCLIF